MRVWLKKLFIILTIVFVILMVTNPSERKFLSKVAEDYGQIHGSELSEVDLIHIGKSNRSSYLLFSTYTYKFGNIGVSYFGIANFTFFVDSFKSSREKDRPVII